AAAGRGAPAWLRVSGELLSATALDMSMLAGAVQIAGVNDCIGGCQPRGPRPKIASASIVLGTHALVPFTTWLIAPSHRSASSSFWASVLGHFLGEVAFFGAALAQGNSDITAPLAISMTLPAIGATLGAELTRTAP